MSSMMSSSYSPAPLFSLGQSASSASQASPSSALASLPTMRSWLQKKGDLINHSWQRRYCVFSDGALRYYSSSTDSEPNGVVKLADMVGVDTVADDAHKYPNVFHLQTPVSDRTYAFSAETPELLREWLSALREAIASYSQTGGKRRTRLSGYLDKRGHINPAWKRRWFVLQDDVLEYADGPEKHTSRSGVSGIPLADVNATSGEGLVILLVGDKGDRTYHLRAESAADKDDWLRYERWRVARDRDGESESERVSE